MACTCADQCPTSAHCIAIGFPDDEHKCWVLCDKDRDEGTPPRLDLDTRVDVETRGVDLLQLAEFLGRRAPVELLVPVSAAREEIALSLKDVPFGDALEQAGIVVAPRV